MLAELNIVDWGIIALLLVSALTSLLRGFVREALSLIVWALAFLLATMFYPRLQVLLAEVIAHPLLQQVVAFLALFLATLVVGSLVASVIGQLLRLSGLGFVDRLLGMVFGLVRGGIIALAIAMVTDIALQSAGARPLWFAESQLVPHLLLLQDWAQDTTAISLAWLTEVLA